MSISEAVFDAVQGGSSGIIQNVFQNYDTVLCNLPVLSNEFVWFPKGLVIERDYYEPGFIEVEPGIWFEVFFQF